MTLNFIFLSHSECNCNAGGSVNASCDDKGKCSCHSNVDGLKCDHCVDGLYGFPSCEGNTLKLDSNVFMVHSYTCGN